MGEGNIKYRIEVNGAQSVVSSGELNRLLAKDVRGLVKVVGPAGEEKKIDSYYLNERNAPVHEKLSAEQIRRRHDIGQSDVIYHGGDDPKKEIWRRDQKYRMERGVASEHKALTATRNFLPFAAELENLAIGDAEEATYYRQLLMQENKFSHGASVLGSFFAGGLAVKTLARGTALSRMVMANRKTLLGKTAQLAGEDIILESYMYANHIKDNNQEFLWNELGSEVATGLVVSSPFIFGFLGRSAIGKAGDAAMTAMNRGDGMGLSRALELGADVSIVKAMATKGKAAGDWIRGSTVARLLSRVTRRHRVSAKVTNRVYEIEDEIAKIIKEQGQIKKNFTPDALGTASKNVDRLEDLKTELRNLSGEEMKWLDDVKWGETVSSAKDFHKGVRALDRTMGGWNKRIKRPASSQKTVVDAPPTPKGRAPRPKKQVTGDVDEAAYNLYVEDALIQLDEAEMSDVLGYLQNTRNLDEIGDSVHAWSNAYMDARLGMLSGTPGAAKAAEVIEGFLRNDGVWKGTTLGRNNKILEGITDIADAKVKLDMFQIPDSLGSVKGSHVTEVNSIYNAVQQIRKGYGKLGKQGVFSKADTDMIEAHLRTLEKKVSSGRQSYFDMKNVNEARESAKKLNDETLASAKLAQPKTPEEFAQLEAEAAISAGSNMVAFRDFVHGAFRWVGDTGGVWTNRTGAFGVIALRHSTTEEEKRMLYETMAENIRAYAGNPLAMADGLGQATQSIEVSAPVFTQMAQQQAGATILYLAQHLPKQSVHHIANSVPEHISVVNKFLDKALAAHEPISVGIAAAMGEVTPGMVESVRMTNPAIYAEMYNVLAAEIANLTPEEYRKVPRATMQGIKTFMGGMDPLQNGYNLMHLQSTYARTAQEEEVMRGGQPTGNTMKNPGPQSPGSDYTMSQRISGY